MVDRLSLNADMFMMEMQYSSASWIGVPSVDFLFSASETYQSNIRCSYQADSHNANNRRNT